MIDPRMVKLADVLIGYSTKVQPGERVLIDAYDVPEEMVCVLINRVVQAGGLPFVEEHRGRVGRAMLMAATDKQLEIVGKHALELMKEMNCYIALRGSYNITETADVPDEKIKLRETYLKPVLDYRVNNTKWVVLRWPTPSMAQLAGMSTEQFENFYFDVCTLDYARMAAAEAPLKDRMEKTDIVRILGPRDTNLVFSIKGMPAVPCVGDRNIPDGEIYTAPIRDSVNGVIHFNAGTVYHGRTFDDIRLVFEDGRITDASGSDTNAINEILDADEGARYIGEFALGFNPHINRPMRDILFDEKIRGSIHLTPGQAYAEADNGNRSKIHWDLVLIQTAEYGGGEIWFDDELIRKDGLFVPDYLQPLNPENLV
ncbi:MAG: aminopeptidase [Armatimonadota bacterium]|nr:aminopeptidase [Armatimonadota bacterium]